MDPRQEKKKKISPRSPLDVRYILIGLLFFVNPCVSVVDVLPDFVGAALVIAGFLHLAAIDDRARSAQKALWIYAFVDAGKAIAALMVRSVSGTTWDLVFTFVFGAAEAALFSYAMLKLFASVTYRASRLDCPEMLSGFSALTGLTVLCAVLKNLLPILPELTELTGNYGTVRLGVAGEQQISHFVYVALTVLNVLVVTAYAVGWWFYMRRYFVKLGRCGGFLSALHTQYMSEVGGKREVLTYRALKSAGIVIFAGLLFLLPLRLDGTDYLPDFVAGILLAIACLRLAGLLPRQTRRALVFSGIYTLFAAAEWAGELILKNSLSVDYDVGYYASASAILLRHPGQMSFYIAIIVLGVIKYIALAVFLFFFFRIFIPVIRDHTGVAFELSSAVSAEKDARIKKTLSRALYVLSALSFLSAGCGIFRRIVRMFSDAMLVEYIELLGVLPLCVLFIWFLAKLETGIDNKYYIER